MSEWNVTITTTNHSVVYSGSLIIGMMKSKNIKKSWYCEFQVHYRALINLHYCNFSGKILIIEFFPKIPGNLGLFLLYSDPKIIPGIARFPIIEDLLTLYYSTPIHTWYYCAIYSSVWKKTRGSYQSKKTLLVKYISHSSHDEAHVRCKLTHFDGVRFQRNCGGRTPSVDDGPPH